MSNDVLLEDAILTDEEIKVVCAKERRLRRDTPMKYFHFNKYTSVVGPGKDAGGYYCKKTKRMYNMDYSTIMIIMSILFLTYDIVFVCEIIALLCIMFYKLSHVPFV